MLLENYLNNTYIIIVTYNGLQWIDTCLKSCNSYNVIVVDNSSTDGTIPFIENNFPEVHIIAQKKNLGFGAANNIGISYALKRDAAYVFLLNQDAYLHTNTIKNLIFQHQKNTKYGILSPIHLDGAGENLDYKFSQYLLQGSNNKVLFDGLKSDVNTIYNLNFVNAAAWLIPKEAIVSIGGFDPIFFHYGEDNNYCQRIIFHGFKIGVITNALVRHDRQQKLENSAISKTKLLRIYEKNMKVKYGNINLELDLEDMFKTEKRKLVKLLFKSLIKFNFNMLQLNLKKWKILNNIKQQICKSRSLNIINGKNYLHYE